MKRVFLAAVLIASAAAFAQTADQGGAPGGQTQGAQGGGSQTKTIADANEYNDYISATQQTDPNAKGAALEAFVQKYPNSVVKEDALQAAMAAYQQGGNLQKSAETASKILQVNPNNVPALAVQTYVSRQNAQSVPPAQQAEAFAKVGEMAQRGLQQLPSYKPNGVPPADVQKQVAAFSQIFYGSAGQAALAAKNYADAQKYLSEAVKASPDNVQDVYPLALAYIQQTPPSDDALLNGVWYMARAYNLVAAQNPQAAQQVGNAGQYYLNKYHGKQPDSQQLWNNVVAMAKASPTPPPNFATSIPKAPSPEQQVKEMLVAANNNIQTMSFGEWVLIFTYGDPQTKQQVFQQIANKPFKFQGQVIDATPDTVHVALTQDAIDAKKAEVEVKLVEPEKKAPDAGSPFAFQANPVKVDSQPFMMFMDQGVDLTPKKPAAGKGKATKGKTKPKSKA
jgi:tetratricopeptide (TPR) repeat protein